MLVQCWFSNLVVQSKPGLYYKAGIIAANYLSLNIIIELKEPTKIYTS